MRAGALPLSARRSGRPPHAETSQIHEKILDVATGLFFTEGYGATSIEAVARRARIAKQTIYHRFENKPALFRAVVQRVIERLKPPDADHLFDGNDFTETLNRLARAILHATLSDEALAVHRVVLAEADRFPELALIVSEQGTRAEAIKAIAKLLEANA
ncbi:MAG: TetR/AcrR family transcriptional regulator, partial [Pseudomonadota bacterium]|nr:TetR/AcrR family transcriptional regulator [Pseudomonadota bacterium]